MYFSKSQYVKGVQCSKLLWLYRHDKSKMSKVNDATQNIFTQGTAVGELATELFPGGSTVELNLQNKQAQVTQTQEFIDSGATDIYEASLIYDDVLVMVDILHKNADGSWDIYEVKSSTSVKEVYHDDVAVQYYVLSNSGFTINKVYVVTINKEYERQGTLDIKQLFAIHDVTTIATDTAQQAKVTQNIQDFKTQDTQAEPQVSLGEQCFLPYECPIRAYCWQNIKTPSGFDLVDLVKEERFPKNLDGLERQSLYANTALSAINANKLNYRQQRQHRAFNDNTPQIVKKKLKEVMGVKQDEYQVLKLHFVSYAVPLYDGYNPYRNTPYGFTLLHVKDSQVLTTEHFLANLRTDPLPQVNEAIQKYLKPNLKIVLFHNGFHMGATKKITAINIDMQINLSKIFANINYYDASFLSDFSLHSILGHFDANIKTRLMSLNINNDDKAVFELKEAHKTLQQELKDYGTLWCEGLMSIYKQLKAIT